MPDQKVVATGILCLAVLCGVLIYHERDYIFNGAHAQTASAASVIVATGTSTSMTTNDDWKNLLNITTASDTAVQILTTDASAQADDSNNITAQLSKNFFSLYLQDQKNGVTIDQDEADNIANEAISGINPLPQTTQYTLADIHVSDNSSDSALLTYQNTMLSIPKKDVPTTDESIGQIVSNGLENADSTELAKLNPLIAGYEKMITDILKVSVPQTIAPYHLILLNTLNSVLSDMQGMQQTLTDPVAGYAAFTAYQTDIVKLQLILNEITNSMPKQ